jgi:hypothetical protein
MSLTVVFFFNDLRSKVYVIIRSVVVLRIAIDLAFNYLFADDGRVAVTIRCSILHEYMTGKRRMPRDVDRFKRLEDSLSDRSSSVKLAIRYSVMHYG